MRVIRRIAREVLVRFVRRSGLAGAIAAATRQIEVEQAMSTCRGAEATFHRGSRVQNPRGPDAIVVGRCSHIAGELMVFPSGGRIEIGQFCSVGPSTRIWSQERVSIGDHVLISHTVTIMDTDGHEADPAARRFETESILSTGLPAEKGQVATGAIAIGNDVWIGCLSVILKGVRIGNRAVVGAGSVVTRDVPDDAVVAGNPARTIRIGRADSHRLVP